MRFSLATTLPPKNEDMVMGEQCHFGDQKKKKFANQFLHQSGCYKTHGFNQIEWT